MHNTLLVRLCIAGACAACAIPAAASGQDTPPDIPVTIDESGEGTAGGPPFGMPDSVLDDTWVTIGIGAGLSPDYSGSDEYAVFPAPIIQGQVGGVRISPRPAGLATDIIDDRGKDVSLTFGPTFRIRSNRNGDIEEEAVAALGELDTAIEVGAIAGISVSKVLHPFDSVSFDVETRWDVAGAHDGMTITPSIGYFTPLSRGAAVILNFDASYADASYMDYYYSIHAAGSTASGLSQFGADEGFYRAGVTAITAVDLNGNVLDGGLGLVFITGYSRMLGDAADSPLVADVGSRDQWLGAVGLGYTF